MTVNATYGIMDTKVLPQGIVQQRMRTDQPSSCSSAGFQHQMALMLCRTQKELLGSHSTLAGRFPSIPVQAPSELCCQLISTMIQRQGMFYICYTWLSLSLCSHIREKEQEMTRFQAWTFSFSMEINKKGSPWCSRKLGFGLVYPCFISQGQKIIRS